MKNEVLFKKNGSKELSFTIKDPRLTLLGHSLRLIQLAPEQIAITRYFSTNNKSLPGRPNTTIASILTKDLKKASIKFRNLDDLDELRNMATDRGG